MIQLIEEIKQYAYDNYGKGWDVVVETMDDEEIEAAIVESGATTLNDAVKWFEEIPGPVGVWLHQLSETSWGGEW